MSSVKIFGVIFLTVQLTLAGACSGAGFPNADNTAVINAQDIDLGDFDLTFEDNFSSLDVSGRRCDSRWTAHTPWNGDFGAATFTDPSRRFPFHTSQGILRIEARKDAATGKYLGGLISLWNPCGEGVAQRNGYFEVKAQLPSGDGMWPAFWLIGTDRSRLTAEIDVFEQHGHMADRFTATARLHPRADGVKPFNSGHMQIVEDGSLSDRFNIYGVEVLDGEVVFYFNRQEIKRLKVPAEFDQAFYPLINLAMDGGYITAQTPDKDFLYVDYIRIYARRSESSE